jgi:cytochrome c556
MKKGLLVVGTLVTVGWLYIGASGAHEAHPTHLPDQKDPIAFRAYLMANVGDNAKELNDKVKAGKIKEAKVNAQAIALHSTRVVDLFPQGSTSEKSRAKEEIWQKWDDFVKLANTFRGDADQMVVVAAEGKPDAATGQMKKVFAGCKSCHDSFRKPEKKEEKS